MMTRSGRRGTREPKPALRKIDSPGFVFALRYRLPQLSFEVLQLGYDLFRCSGVMRLIFSSPQGGMRTSFAKSPAFFRPPAEASRRSGSEGRGRGSFRMLSRRKP